MEVHFPTMTTSQSNVVIENERKYLISESKALEILMECVSTPEIWEFEYGKSVSSVYPMTILHDNGAIFRINFTKHSKTGQNIALLNLKIGDTPESRIEEEVIVSPAMAIAIQNYFEYEHTVTKFRITYRTKTEPFCEFALDRVTSKGALCGLLFCELEVLSKADDSEDKFDADHEIDRWETHFGLASMREKLSYYEMLTKGGPSVTRAFNQ